MKLQMEKQVDSKHFLIKMTTSNNNKHVVILKYYHKDLIDQNQLSLVMRKPDFCICENKDADQLRGYREADQCLCFRYTDSTIPLLPKSEISSL